MRTTFRIMLKSAAQDTYLLFWSILLPMALLIGLGLYFNSPEYRARLLAGVIGISTLFWAMETTVFHILQQRNRGVYKLLKITPMKISSFIIALTFAWTVVSLAVATIIFLAGVFFFGIQTQLSSVFSVCGVLIIATLCFTFLSFLVANISKNEGQASTFSSILAMPMLFLSSAFYSLDTAPAWIKALTWINPFSHFVNGLNYAISSDLWDAAVNIFILIGFSVMAMIAAILTFRWNSNEP